MNSENDPTKLNYEDEQFEGGRRSRRSGGINLTGMGARIAVTAIVVGLMALIISYFMRVPTEDSLTENGSQAPDIQITIAPTWTIELPQQLATATPEATSTPPPPEPTAPPTQPELGTIVVGGNATVTGTGTDGVNMRQGGGTNFPVIETLTEGTVFEIIGGPSDKDGYSWWQIRLDNGTEGWVVQEFITP